MTAELIQAVPVERDSSGWWSHPGIPDFEEDHAAWKAWQAQIGIETIFSSLEGEAETHPSYIDYYENSGSDVSQWNPEPPKGEGWFVFSIHDTEDGPVFVWARSLLAAITKEPGHE